MLMLEDLSIAEARACQKYRIVLNARGCEVRKNQAALTLSMLLSAYPLHMFLALGPIAPSANAESATTNPDAYKLNMLIRTTLIALSQANRTGNYSVLRDLGTPQFQASNTDARLSEIFANLRNRNIDFSPILFFDPKLVRPAAVQPNGMLRMTGYIDTRPERVLFDIGFEQVNKQWCLSAIIVDMQAPAAKTAQRPKATANAPAAAERQPAKPLAKGKFPRN
ncbi:hypothetical protein [Hyphomicrobium sp. D-2]|uniref:hypothetical protein n=1 Tax=Hyphomicrobium sp. D-2 TaxID=3041621 RepID=UPI002457BBDA|nr:hypothetical protein [Hyphomicrobium sp. D-2]MDH4981173.1 hypothetical protein [Hyphomicrobium sp. D-2]